MTFDELWRPNLIQPCPDASAEKVTAAIPTVWESFDILRLTAEDREFLLQVGISLP
jgi:hypothetical protein